MEFTATSEQTPKRGSMMRFLGIILSTWLLMASLWQIEVSSAYPGDVFDFPFYLWRVNEWWARGFWCLVNVVSWVLAVPSTVSLVRTHHWK
jgi:hypothetical protein